MYRGERFNSITHLVGAVLALAGLVILVVMAARQHDAWKITSFSIYGATLFLLYMASTLYHSLRGRWKNIFQKFDHQAIYLLIAGTYTPFTLVSIRGPWGWSIFGVIWGLALAGMLLEIFSKKDGRRILPVLIYLAMGWIVLIALGPMVKALPNAALWWMLAGGLFYSVGVVFYALTDRVRHAHGIWHLFVLAGSISHYVTVLGYVAWS